MGSKIYRRLDIEDRMVIQACLHDHRTLEQIATRVNVSKSTISRELNRNVTLEPGTSIRCITLKTLIVCNTCCKKAYCNKQKRYYNFKRAHELASTRNHLARSISKLEIEAIKDIDHIVTDGVRLGQSLHHIYVGDKSLRKYCCERTIRRLIYRGNLSIRPHQLRRYVCYKREYKKETPDLQLRDIRALIGRTHKEFVRYCLPKSKSLNDLTQPMIDEMFSHINSYTRKSKQDKTPYDLVKARFGKPLLDAINIVRIPNKKVKLLPIV
jgi:IS30 family transposase